MYCSLLCLYLKLWVSKVYLFVNFREPIEFWSPCSCGVHLLVLLFCDTLLCFDVSEQFDQPCFLFGCWILCHLLVGWLIEKMFSFHYVIFFVEHHHRNPLVCSKDYSAVIPFQFFYGLKFFPGDIGPWCFGLVEQAEAYSRGLSESFKNTCKKYGIQLYFRGGKTIRNLLVAPKDKEHIFQKSGIIYRFKCDRVECDEEYIGESARTFGERFKEYLKCPSPIYDHSNITGHSITLHNFSIVGREEQNLTRLIKEAIFIRVNNPSVNKNIGKYHLPHIWDEVLNNITELKLK